MSQIVLFAATCPSCKRGQRQDAFTVADLLRLLDGGYPIEAYCVRCEEFWSISLRERLELGELVAAACKDSPRFEGTNCPTQRPSEDTP